MNKASRNCPNWIVLVLILASGVFAEDLWSQQAGAEHVREMAEGMNLFKNKVRAILENNCLECHGEGEIEGDFNLSSRELLFAGGLVGESAEKSDLVDSITHQFEPYMPHERDKLNDESISAIARWIDLGAPYDKPLIEGAGREATGPMIVTAEDREYWAYQSLSDIAVPDVENDLWPQTELDHFILNRLEERKLTPNDQAKRRVLIRRAYLNAIGLPPKPEEVASFLNDFKPLAYERMIDRLLESPHYGERWARHWMDIARFGESTGFEIDFDRPFAYHYRDFLIKAFNQNMPYDQFVQWQVAGDELNPEEPLALMATGFLGAGAFSSVITEKEFESSRYDELDDMVNTLGTAFLGTTIGCARCHDHKYDPIPTRDYYELASVFTKTRRTYVDHDPNSGEFEALKSQFKLIEGKLAQELSEYEETVLEKPFQAWLERGNFELPADRWIVLSPDTFISHEGAPMEKLWDDSVLVNGQDSDQENESLFFEFETQILNMVGLRMETLTHPNLPNNGPGSDHEGGFTVREVIVHIKDLGAEESQWKVVPLESAEATSQENNLSLSAAASINKITFGWSIDFDAFGKEQALVIRFSKPVGFELGSRIKITVLSGLNVHQSVGRPRFSVTQDPNGPLEISEGTPAPAYQGLLKLIVGRSPKALSREEQISLRSWFGRGDSGWISLRDKLIDHELTRPKTTKIRIMACSDSLPPVWHRSANRGFPSYYESTHFLERGDVDQKGEIAKPGFLGVLLQGTDSTAVQKETDNPRTQLARWLTDVESGAGSLLARVFVNRIWQHHFGRGIVATPSDFGSQGGNPSHPKLLEWLAKDFVDNGWEVKRLQKQIMTSAVYRQSSEFVKTKSELDIDNALLWRFGPRRVEAEVVRDSLLQVSGLLDPTQFGPGPRDPDMRRRSVYFFIKRGALIPEMVLFDWPEHLVGIGRRVNTTIAPQALQFLNSPQTRRYAKGFAERLSGNDNLEELIKKAYGLALSRFPSAEEKNVSMEFIQTQKDSYLKIGYDEKLAIVDYCQSLFSLNEFIYIR